MATAVKHAALNTIVGRKIFFLRLKAEISQSELANAIGVSRPIIGNIESGVHGMTIYNLLAISKVLKVKITDMLPSEREYHIETKEINRSERVAHLEEKIKQLKREVRILKNEL